MKTREQLKDEAQKAKAQAETRVKQKTEGVVTPLDNDNVLGNPKNFNEQLTEDFSNASKVVGIQITDQPVPCPYAAINWEALRAKVALNPTGRFIQEAIYPEDSILQLYMEQARTCCESPDIFLLESIRSVTNALLGRRVYIRWGTGNLYPNSFHLIIGTAGTRKTIAIRCAKRVALDCLPAEAFLSTKQSVEALFSEYHPDEGGQPDKLLMVEEGNVVMSTWAKSDYGARVAAEFLQLYDCCELNESFLRNKSKKSGPKRVVPETSTSVVIAGTFGVATFPLAQVKEGIERRFFYGVAETLGRTLYWPQQLPPHQLSDLFKPLLKFSGPIEMPQQGEVWDCWVDFQRQNRTKINEVGTDDEPLAARLNSCPVHVLKTAVTYEICRAVKAGYSGVRELSLKSLESAIEYVKGHMCAAEFLARYAQRKAAQEHADVILATVRKDFQVQRADTIYVTRTDLTRKFCMHTGRLGALTVEDLFLRVLPELERQGEACLAFKRGKSEVYAFHTETEFTT